MTKEDQDANELYCQLGIKLIEGTIPYKNWKKFCETYCHYVYIFPDDRMINSLLMDTIYKGIRKTASELMRFVLLLGQIECHFTEVNQARMLSILIAERAKKLNRKIGQIPEFRATIETQNAQILGI